MKKSNLEEAPKRVARIKPVTRAIAPDERYDANVDHILSSAAAVFAEKSFGLASIRDIAARAKISTTDDPEERLRLFIRSHLEYHMSNLAEMKVLVREADSLTGRYAADITRLKREYSRICRRLLEGYAAHRNKTLDREQTRILTSLLFGAMNWFYTWYEPARDYDQRSRIMDECFRMIAGTLSAR